VIPARLAATRLPGKPLRLLGGRALVVRVWERVSALPGLSRCVIATDSAEIVDTARRAGADAVLTRGDHPSGTDRVAEVAARPDMRDYSIVLNIQGDEPFVPAEAASGAIALIERGFELGTAATVAGRDVLAAPDIVKVVVSDEGRALYFSRAPIPFLRDADDAASLAGQVRQHLGVYAYRRDALARWVALPPHPLERIERLEQLRPLAAGMVMGVCDVAGPPAGGVDTEDDLERANVLWTSMTEGRG